MRLPTVFLGSVSKVRLSAKPSAIMCWLFLWVVYGTLGGFLFKLPLSMAIVGGLLALILHWLSSLAHQLGHVWAGRRVGYAATGIEFWWIFSTTLYPADEPTLPTTIHLQRALGGPALNLLLAIAAALLSFALLPVGGFAWRIAAVLAMQNVLAFTVGLLPLGFTDGSTLLRLRHAHSAQAQKV